MTRFKKELKKRGYLFEEDYPFLPYEGIESISADATKATYSCYHDATGSVTTFFDRSLEPEISFIDEDDFVYRKAVIV